MKTRTTKKIQNIEKGGSPAIISLCHNSPVVSFFLYVAARLQTIAFFFFFKSNFNFGIHVPGTSSSHSSVREGLVGRSGRTCRLIRLSGQREGGHADAGGSSSGSRRRCRPTGRIKWVTTVVMVVVMMATVPTRSHSVRISRLANVQRRQVGRQLWDVLQ